MTTGSASVVEKNVLVRNLRVPAEEGQLSRVRDFIAECCDEAGFSTRETNNTKLAVDEACTNIIKHAYRRVPGDIEIQVRIKPGDVSVTLFDTGERFDFAGVKDPDLDQYVETGRKGGLGVFLINRLMDDVQYRAGPVGNELFMRKASHAVISAALPGKIAWRGTLRYKFTLRASLGLLALIAAIWAFVFIRQTKTIGEQRATQWVEKRRLAENLAERSKAALLIPEEYSVEQTNITAFITRILEGNDDLAYVRIVDSKGEMLSSGNIDEIFTRYVPPPAEVLLRQDDRVIWSRLEMDGRKVRDIEYLVQVKSGDSNQSVTLGSVHVGVLESAVERDIADPRFVTSLILIGFFLVGVLLIAGLVSVFVKPIQVLTDGVRAIGQGSLDSKISVEGPAEIGAIAAVFNEITEKFKKAQEGVLEREKLQKEIEVAKQIQQALLPKKHPDISGYDIAPYYQAAKEVGGDYYDFVQVDEDTLGVVVADVSGKGVPGSLVMTMIRTALRMEARGNKNASDVMAKMNDFVTDDMKKGMFVTMFYVILDSKNRIISFASAGHNPMILYRAESNETFFLNPKGFPVGISLPDETLFRKSISLEKIKLKKDDMLVIYTDGVTEAMNEKRDQYGEERLIATIKKYGHLHPAEFIAALEHDVKAFTGGNPQNDDITVVAVKEKLAADDVLFGIRKRLIDMVEVQGMSVKEACAAMKMSPATYYRYKRRMEVMGERGLKNKVLRQETDLKRVSIEQRREIIAIIKGNPELGAKRITEEFNKGKDPSDHLTEKLVYDELKRLALNTRELRIEYLRRHKLYDEDASAARKKSREMVEDLLKEVSGAETLPPVQSPETPPVADELEEALSADDGAGRAASDTTRGGAVSDGEIDALVESGLAERIGDLDLSVVQGTDEVTIIRIEGHLDSVSTGALEQKMNQIIAEGGLNLVVDLARVPYISSGGWGILVGEVKRLREKGGDVVLVGMMSEVYDVYELLGFADILKALPDVDAARGYFRKSLAERLAEKPRPPLAPSGAGLEAGARAGEKPFVDLVKTDAYQVEWDSLRIEAGTVGEKGEIAVLSLAGIVDTVSAENLRQAIDRVIKNGIHRIVVDMSLVEYVSSGGWGTFTERLREIRRKGGDIKLFGMDPDVYYVFTMLGFNIVLSSFDILTEAIEDFKRAAGKKPSRHPSALRALLAGPGSEAPGDAAHADETAEIAAASSTSGRPRGHPHRRDGAWRESDGVLIGTISGSIEARAVEKLDGDLSSRLDSKPVCVLLDLGDVDYISSTGWGLMAKYHEQLQDWGGALTLCRMRPELHEIFRLLELDSVIKVYATQDEAVRAVEGRVKDHRVSRGHPLVPGPESKYILPYIEGDEEVLDLERAESRGAGPRDAEIPESERHRFEALDGERATEDRQSDVDELLGGVQETEESHLGRREGGPAGEDEPKPAPPREGRDSHRIEVDSILDEEHLAEDKKLREIGWEQYGEWLRKGRRKRAASREEEDDE
jgi:anti-anti-sigma factor